MSKISTIYDGLVTRLEALYTTHKRIPHPINIEDNSHAVLRKGFGLSLAGGENVTKETGCLRIKVSRDIIVVLTRETNQSDYVVGKRSTAEKNLFEDQLLLIKDVEDDFKLGTSDVLIAARYISDSGTEFVIIDKSEFIKLETVINVSYYETL